MSKTKISALDPNAKYAYYDRLMEITEELLPALDDIASAAAVVTEGRHLDHDQARQLNADIENAGSHSKGLKAMIKELRGAGSQEALFVRGAIGGGLKNLLSTISGFTSFPDDPEFAQDVKRRHLHPFFRLVHDVMGISDDNYATTRVNFTMGGKAIERTTDHSETMPCSADLVEVSKAVYAVMFSAILLSNGERDISLDFTAQADGPNAEFRVVNSDGIVTGALSSIAGDVDLQPPFLRQAFASGLSVHGNMIRIPFRIAAIQ